MRLISEVDVDRLVDPRMAVEIAAAAFMRQSSGSQPLPGRLDLRRSEPRAGMLVLSGYSSGGLGIVKSNMHTYLGSPPERTTASLLALWDMRTCQPLALISSAAFNGHRTASGFAAAARVLARSNASMLTVFGAGHMAAPTIAYLAAVRPIRHVLVKSRRLEQAEQLTAELSASSRFSGISFEATADAERAAAAAEIIACVTSADAPVFPGEAVRPGTFVVLGGANRPSAREVDDVLIKRALIYADHLAGCLEKAGDIRVPLANGTIREGDLAGEIGTLLAMGSSPPLADIVAFKSIGIAPQDLALAEHVLERADAAGAGTIYDPISGCIGGSTP